MPKNDTAEYIVLVTCFAKKKVLRQNPGEKIERESILLIYKNVVINIDSERLIVVGLDSSQGIYLSPTI